MSKRGEQRDTPDIEVIGEDKRDSGSGDVDVDDMVVGEMDFDDAEQDTSSSRVRAGKEVIRGDAEEVVNGTSFHLHTKIFEHTVVLRPSAQHPPASYDEPQRI